MYLRSLIICLLAVLLIPALPAQAKAIRIETRKSSTPNGKPAAALAINGEVVLQLAKDQRGHEPMRCVSIIAADLAEAYRTGGLKFEVKQADPQDRAYTLVLNGKVLVLATDQEGKAWGAEPSALAETWRKNIEQALASDMAGVAPVLTPELPAAHPPVAGNAAAEVQFVFEHSAMDAPPDSNIEQPAASNSGIIDFDSAGSRNHPDYKGLVVTSGNTVYQPPASTQISSSELPSTGTVRLTGKKPTSELLNRAIDNALRVCAGIGPEAKLNWQNTVADEVLEAPASGSVKTLALKYTAAGRPEATVTLTLENRALATPRESLTYFSNRPERIDREQLLYFAELPGRQSARLVYHHQLARNQDLRFVARVVNTGSTASAVYIVPGDAAPDVNTFYVGYLSAENFWKNMNRGNGYVASLPPGGQAVLIEHRLTGGQTGSGYYKLVNLGDNPLLVETLTLNPGTPIPPRAIRDREGASGTVYGPPYYTISEKYECGDPWKYLRLGDDNPASMTGGPALDGCYGMTHSFSVEISNPLDRPALVFVVLRGSAGEVKGQFYINDEYVGTPLVKGGDEQLLKEIPLKPGETKLLKINAMPLNGGFYPASIILRESRYP
jgi:hypothetical protein